MQTSVHIPGRHCGSRRWWRTPASTGRVPRSSSDSEGGGLDVGIEASGKADEMVNWTAVRLDVARSGGLASSVLEVQLPSTSLV